MHMTDALISPVVGGLGWAAAIGLSAVASRRMRNDPAASRPALMGVLGAFVFAAQMVNFAIPGTGSSGHLGGGLLLAVILGPDAAFLAMTSVLTVQALLFADGGLLALGCNIVNMGLFTCYVAYPLVYRPLAGFSLSRKRLTAAAIAAAVAGLLMGAFAVVLETTSSGVAQLPFATFTLFMLPIHLGIGVVEGLVTAGVLLYVAKARPDLLQSASNTPGSSLRPLLLTLLAASVFVGGLLSWFASPHPDGLEWSAARAGDQQLAEPSDGLLARIQDKTALLPDYSLPATSGASEAPEESWPAPSVGTSLSGIVGAGLTLVLAAAAGLGIRMLRSRDKPGPSSQAS